ncbi:hypothetical protein CKC_03505 [Candidatus Liberibacter solanacearum CLso-ZC1]|uniref:Uncharacterized protein n=1 Tax=Liberibacter solanacearum (strain CLso-ZC1) TaxID=658172 RepID=E4UBE5_LIBSC|nr:hypothetical protein CKC_03505 [Candidatus Liberibacter solanacearum CLso-ZC1]
MKKILIKLGKFFIKWILFIIFLQFSMHFVISFFKYFLGIDLV